MPRFDIVIVGAGAAGIAAARWLRANGSDALLLEARERIGGRAHTDSSTLGMPLDHGCAWLHSAAENPWATVARESGFSIIEQPPDWRRQPSIAATGTRICNRGTSTFRERSCAVSR